jgi:DNA-binding LacI/PurR family transcriptional regulator
MPIIRLSTKPLYGQLKDTLRRQILEGELQPGALMPSERQLCEQHEVSSTTVRRALQELVREGLVRRRAGLGTFVSTKIRRRILLIVVGFEKPAWRERSYFFSDLIAGIAAATWESGAIFSVVHVEDSVESLISSMIEEMAYDGFLLRLEGDLEDEYLTPLLETGFPYVIIKRYAPHRPINCVVVDDEQIAIGATNHLIELGHTRIGLISTQNVVHGRDRYLGYLKALEAHGLDIDPSLVCLAEDYYEECGFGAAAKLLALRDRPTAIFAASDLLAVGAYSAIEEAGLRIPEDVAVLGCADIPVAASLSPPLTTIRVPYYDLGLESTKLLLDLICNSAQPPKKITIGHELVVRESCGRLRA